MATGDSDDDVSDLSCVVVYVGTREKETLTENVQYKVKERSLYASGAWPANGNEQTAVFVIRLGSKSQSVIVSSGEK